MAQAKYIDAADDMLIDFDKIDRKNRGSITPAVKDSILRMGEMELDAEWIARQLEVPVQEVQLVLEQQGYRFR